MTDKQKERDRRFCHTDDDGPLKFTMPDKPAEKKVARGIARAAKRRVKKLRKKEASKEIV